MRKLIVLAFWATAIIGGAAYAQNVPKEVRTFLDNYMKNTMKGATAEGHLSSIKRDSTDWVKTLRTEYIACYSERFSRMCCGAANYYDNEDQSQIIKPCLEEVKTGIRKERTTEPQYGQNGFFINTNALQENQKVHEKLKKTRAQQGGNLATYTGAR